ncbi:hypothetical protein PGT21_036507 [Puccinia graminis f. sp. tritici]|uniref:Uncharacterized protein n=1 Tax=Puccinia graminis f. sp. tritici TaxID=56615 RepID=A0A5B0PKS5_PUCGR|nr:hypothetical protein PGT21_036507 [Puccinia graminis f. sp. tritici]
MRSHVLGSYANRQQATTLAVTPTRPPESGHHTCRAGPDVNAELTEYLNMDVSRITIFMKTKRNLVSLVRHGLLV